MLQQITMRTVSKNIVAFTEWWDKAADFIYNLHNNMTTCTDSFSNLFCIMRIDIWHSQQHFDMLECHSYKCYMLGMQ